MRFRSFALLARASSPRSPSADFSSPGAAMNVHEYQAKAILKAFGVSVPEGAPAMTTEEARTAAKKLGGSLWVVKAQIHAGGRGKGRFTDSGAGEGGGVRLARSFDEVGRHADAMLGHTLVTHQTGAAGKQVNRIYIEQGTEIANEFYLSVLVDRSSGRVAFVVSTEGGVNIEEVAAASPEKIVTFAIDPATGFLPHYGRRIAAALKLKGDLAKQAAKLGSCLYVAFTSKDMSLLEVNPLVVTSDQRLVCLDAKMGFDSNALERHPDIVELRDKTEENEKEIEASNFDLSYIALDGTIGCMVNGAGLAMATMDIIKLYGEEPANFLDVGGGASREKVTAAFKIITSDPRVRGILVNIFGGIMRCDVIAEGIVEAVNEVGLKVPLVVRLEGTNVDKGKAILSESGLDVIPADDLDDAARKIVAAVRGQR
jgi:succinyl-CoA synthetase beta subunit